MYTNVIFQTTSFYITQAVLYIFLFMYLGELLQYYHDVK